MNTICWHTGEICPAAVPINGRLGAIEDTRQQQIDQSLLAMQENATASPSRRQAFEEEDFALLDANEDKAVRAAQDLVSRCGQPPSRWLGKKFLDCSEVAAKLDNHSKSQNQSNSSSIDL